MDEFQRQPGSGQAGDVPRLPAWLAGRLGQTRRPVPVSGLPQTSLQSHDAPGLHIDTLRNTRQLKREVGDGTVGIPQFDFLSGLGQ